MAFERITQKDWYKILGAKPSDSPAELKRKYQKLALLYHPDKQKADAPAGEVEERVQRFIEIDQAWKILGNEETKKEYDLQQRACQVLLQVTEVSIASLAVDFTAVDPQLVLEHEPLTVVSEKKIWQTNGHYMHKFIWRKCPGMKMNNVTLSHAGVVGITLSSGVKPKRYLWFVVTHVPLLSRSFNDCFNQAH